MKQLKEILNNLPRNGDHKSLATTSQSDALDIEAKLEIVASTFKAAYPNVFSSIFSNETDFDNWCALWADVISKLNTEQIKTAIKKTVYTQDYPPSPAQFMKSALGIVPAKQAYEVAINYFPRCFETEIPPINTLIQQAGHMIISWDWRHYSYKELQDMFCSCYEIACRRALGGDYE